MVENETICRKEIFKIVRKIFRAKILKTRFILGKTKYSMQVPFMIMKKLKV